MALLSSTFPLSFSHNKTPALSHWSSDKIIPPLFPPSTPSHTSWLKHDPAAAGNGHLQHSFLSLARCLFRTICSPRLPSSTHTWNRSQIISSTLSVVRQLLSLLVTSSPPAAVPCSTLRGPSSIISIPHAVGATSSCVSPRVTSLLLLVCNSQPIIPLPLVCSGIISTSRWHSVSYPSQQRRQEDGG